MRIRNKILYVGPGRDHAWLKTVQEDYTIMGVDTELLSDRLIVYAIARRKPKPEKADRPKGARGKRRFERT